MQRNIIGLGEALWDMLPEGAKLGGAPANFAYHASQFGHSALAVSALGNDDLGNQTVKEFDNKRLNYIMPRVPFPTGTVGVTLDAKGVPSYDIKTDVAWDNIPFTSEIQEAAANSSAVCFGTLAQRNEISRTTIMRFLDATPADCLKIFDINLRANFYTKEIIQHSLERCNILKINDEELDIVAKMFDYKDIEPETLCEMLLAKYNLDILVLTCGTHGSYVFAPGLKSFQNTPIVEVADTVGAGDSFTGSFTAAILAGKSIHDAHKLSVEVSAFVCTQKGAMPKLPKRLADTLQS